MSRRSGKTIISGVEKAGRSRRAEAVVNGAFAIGVVAMAALVAIAMVGGDAAATAAVPAVGGIVAAVVRLATQYLSRLDQ